MKPQSKFYVVSWLDAALCSLQDALVHIDDLDCSKRRSDVKRAIGLIMDALNELRRFSRVSRTLLEAAKGAGLDAVDNAPRDLNKSAKHVAFMIGMIDTVLSNIKDLMGGER